MIYNIMIIIINIYYILYYSDSLSIINIIYLFNNQYHQYNGDLGNTDPMCHISAVGGGLTPAALYARRGGGSGWDSPTQGPGYPRKRVPWTKKNRGQKNILKDISKKIAGRYPPPREIPTLEQRSINPPPKRLAGLDPNVADGDRDSLRRRPSVRTHWEGGNDISTRFMPSPPLPNPHPSVTLR